MILTEGPLQWHTALVGGFERHTRNGSNNLVAFGLLCIKLGSQLKGGLVAHLLGTTLRGEGVLDRR